MWAIAWWLARRYLRRRASNTVAGLTAGAGAPPAPPLVFAFELRATVADPVVLGQVPHGLRSIVGITGGTVRGPLLNGSVVPNSGADWQLIQPDGFSELDTRYTLRTDKGQLVYVQNVGIRHAPPDVMQKLNSGQVVPGWELRNPSPPPPPEKGPPPPARRPILSVVAVTANLKPEDRVIVDGVQKARPGSPVVPEEWVMSPP